MTQQLTSIQQAACNALAAWLSTQLADQDIVVEPRWTEPDRSLPPKQITIILAGPRREDWMQPEIVQATVADEGVAPNIKPRVDAIWSLGFSEQGLQLDVWAQSDVELDDIRARLDTALNQGNVGLGITNVDPFDVGLRLPLGDGWEPGVIDILFEEGSGDPTAGSVADGEWRAMYRGRASMQLTQRAKSPRMARVLLKQRLYERSPVDQAEDPVTTILLPDP